MNHVTDITRMLRGHDHVETTSRGVLPHRLPAWVGAQFPDPQLSSMEAQPSGVRLAMVTEAQSIELVTHTTRIDYRGIERPRGSVDLVIEQQLVSSDLLTGGDAIETDLQTGSTSLVSGPPHLTRFEDIGAGEKLVELWLPHNERVEIVKLRADAPLTPAPTTRRAWLHHGSSISHGSNATTPARIWPAVAARLGGVELRNLGFGGSALVDPFTARAMRDTPADVISLKLGINVVNSDSMRLRSFVPAVHGFLDTIRDGHPTTPILLVSPIYCGIHEDTPGPGAIAAESFSAGRALFEATGETGDTAQGRLTLRVIRDALSSVFAHRDDENLHYLDGTELYGAEDAAEHPLPDALHPDTGTHEVIGTRFARHAFGEGGPLAAPGIAER
ncbi:SGNH/GDSL hydrolase family protein [Dietzia lutea]|uniref:Lipase n=1 Tax=Dietzia lutea TaxID=546160 RepID=A0A2S1R9B8_9ACTN|nr:SGNH/GDSL hydrolase family protein [Dietzia lutea]AWH92873.1 lipase [Dietzia lutea]